MKPRTFVSYSQFFVVCVLLLIIAYVSARNGRCFGDDVQQSSRKEAQGYIDAYLASGIDDQVNAVVSTIDSALIDGEWHVIKESRRRTIYDRKAKIALGCAQIKTATYERGNRQSPDFQVRTVFGVGVGTNAFKYEAGLRETFDRESFDEVASQLPLQDFGTLGLKGTFSDLYYRKKGLSELADLLVEPRKVTCVHSADNDVVKIQSIRRARTVESAYSRFVWYFDKQLFAPRRVEWYVDHGKESEEIFGKSLEVVRRDDGRPIRITCEVAAYGDPLSTGKRRDFRRVKESEVLWLDWDDEAMKKMVADLSVSDARFHRLLLLDESGSGSNP